MIDFRMKTFLTLCKEKNYTKTAQALHITQPAVSQHIKYLEEYYDSKLIENIGKQFNLTQKGQILYEFISTMQSDSEKLKEILREDIIDKKKINFGATLTIGEYVMPKIITSILTNCPQANINMKVENTHILLNQLQNGEIDFALIEGYFDKSKYECSIFSYEEFIPICSSTSKFADVDVCLHDLLDTRLILREQGSGTRDVLEQILIENNLNINSFDCSCSIGNMNVIKDLVSDNFGISFMYKAAADDDLKKGRLSKINIKDFYACREFNFVFLKNSLHKNEYLSWLELFKEKL